MARRTIPFTKERLKRAIEGVKSADIEVKTIRIEPDGAIVFNSEVESYSEKQLEESSTAYL